MLPETTAPLRQTPYVLRVQIATRPVWLCRCAHHPVAQGALEEGYITTTARTEGPRRVLRGCASTLGQPLPLGSTGGTIGASETSPGRCYCSTWCAVTCAVPCSVYSTDGTVCMMQACPCAEHAALLGTGWQVVRPFCVKAVWATVAASTDMGSPKSLRGALAGVWLKERARRPQMKL